MIRHVVHVIIAGQCLSRARAELISFRAYRCVVNLFVLSNLRSKYTGIDRRLQKHTYYKVV